MNLSDFMALKPGETVWWRNPENYGERVEIEIAHVEATVPDPWLKVVGKDGKEYTGEPKDFFSEKPKRLFYRHVVMIEILSEEPYDDDQFDIETVAYNVTDGPDSGDEKIVTSNQIVTGKQMAKMLRKQGSDPAFFNLDDDGNDTEEP